MFTFKLGIFHVPNIGKVDTRNELSNDTLLALYENRKFPFIGITEEVVPYLKKQKLSEKRAAALKDHLVTSGVSPDRVKTIGYGETKPIDENNTAKGRKNNRRAEINRSAKLKID